MQKPSLLFSLGIYPFKIAIDLPSCVHISLKRVNIACKEQHISPPPLDLADGTFKFVREVEGVYIYCYHFSALKGCSAIDSDFHGRLPPSRMELMDIHTLLKYRKDYESGVGKLVNQEDQKEFVSVADQDGDIVTTYKRRRVEPVRNLERDI